MSYNQIFHVTCARLFFAAGDEVIQGEANLRKLIFDRLRRVLVVFAAICALGSWPEALHADTITVVGAGGETISVTTSTTGNATIISNPNTATIAGSAGSSGIVVTTTTGSPSLEAVTVTNAPGFTIYSTNAGGNTPPTSNGIYGAVDVSRASSFTLVNGAGASIIGPDGVFYDMSSGGIFSSITNSGTIYGFGGGAIGDGIFTYSSISSIVNNTGAIIEGAYDGISTNGSINYLNNSGTIRGTGNNGVFADVSIGNLINSGLIQGGVYGVATYGFGNVSNSGSISGGNNGIYFEDGGSITNYGMITAGNQTVYAMSGIATVYNSGTIQSTGSSAIQLQYGGVVTLVGGSVIAGGGGVPIILNQSNGAFASTVNIIGRASITAASQINDVILEQNSTGTLNLNLAGLTPAKLAQLQLLNGDTSGTFTLGNDTYAWNGLTLVDQAISLEEVVDPGLIGAAKAFDNATSSVGLPAAFDPFYVAAASNPEAALNELVGREINQGIDTLGVNLNTTLTSDINEHLDNLLTSDQIGGFDVSGLHIGNAGGLYAMSDTSGQLDSLLRMTGSSVFGGTDLSTDGNGMVSVTPEQPKWGIWASGNVTLGDESGNNTLSGFHSTMGSPTLGLDYRVTPNVVLGVLGNYTTGGANFDDGNKIGIDTEIAALYGTWRDGNWHVNGIAGGGTLQLNDTRTTFGGGTAVSSPRGDDIVTDWTGGYDFHLGDRWNITPEVGLQYTHLDVSSFNETGAGVFDLSEGDQDIDSLRSHVGFNLNKAYSLGKDLTFIPDLRALWYHEFMDDSRGISTSLPGAPALGSFDVNTLSPQRDFALVGVGLNTAFTGYRGVPIGLFLNYDAQVGQSKYIANSVNAGIRVDF